MDICKTCHCIQDVSKLNGKTSGMNSSYRERQKKEYDNIVTDWSERVFLLSAHRHVLFAGIICDTPVTIVTQVIKLQVTQELHNYRVIRPFSNVSAIPAIRTCRRALGKYTLGQLCNYTFQDLYPFFSSLYMFPSSIP
jgi:hypothetical protein